MLPICYQHIDESLLSLKKTSTLAVAITGYSSLSGLLIGWWIAQPPTTEKVEVRNLSPIIGWTIGGTFLGILISLLIIWRKSDWNQGAK